MTTYVSLYKNLDALSEYDRKFAEQRQEAVLKHGYVPLKRFRIDDQEHSPIQTSRWIQQDRRHFALWRLNRKQKAERIRQQMDKKRQESLALLINVEYELLENAFWLEAPTMLPYQRKYWFEARWADYYWTHTTLKSEIAELESESKLGELLWAEIPFTN